MDHTTSTSEPSIIGLQSAASVNVTATDFYVNGTQITTEISSSAATINSSGNGSLLGGFSNVSTMTPVSTYDYNGYIYELIVFTEVLNATERVIVENYLSSKYGNSVANDYYSYDSNHGNQVSGIGRTSSSDYHLESYSSELGLQIISTDFADGVFALLGHNGGNTSFSTSERPNGDTKTQKIGREWRVDLTGAASEAINLLLDLTGFSLPLGDYNDYGIFVDSNGDFTSGAIFYPVSDVSGDIYRADNVTINDGDYITIAAITRDLFFASSTGSDFENNTAPTFDVEMSYPSNSAVTVDVDDDATGSAGGSDYSYTSQTLTFSAGSTTETVTNLTVSNDIDLEADETINFSLSNNSGASIGTLSSFEFTIQDDDNPRKIQFSAATSNGQENVTSVTIQVEINSVDMSNNTTADYAITGGTATGGGADYTLASGTVTVLSTETTADINLTVINDVLNEADETIIITLSNPTNSNLDTNTQHTYTILDDDNPPSVNFSSPTSTAMEGDGTKTVTMTISAVSGADIDVTFSINVGSTASGSGADYTLVTSSPIIFSAGETSKNIEFTIIDDNTEEGSEDIIIDIDGAAGANLGSTTQHTLTIEDIDEIGDRGPGGIGLVDGSSSLELWLDAADGVENSSASAASDGESAEYWRDNSGNSRDMQNTIGSNPVFRSSGGVSYVDFSTTASDYLHGPVILSGTTARTVYSVVQLTSLTASSTNSA